MLFLNKNSCPDTKTLSYDQACLDILNKLNKTVTVFGQYEECHKCRFENLSSIAPMNNFSMTVSTRSPLQLFYTEDNVDQCHFEKIYFEHYLYGWNITDGKCGTPYIKEPADDAYLPILTAFIVLFCFGTAWYMVKCIYKNSYRFRSLLNWNNELEDDLGSSSLGTPLVIERTPAIRKHPHRIKSLDVFRGLCIMLMIFVNYGGAKYYFFQHSTWNGLTVADLVFPWFIWIMGMSLTISMQSKLRRAVPRRQLVIQTIRRFIVLLFLGISVNSMANMTTIADLRFPGVLQRIAIVYLIVGLLEIIFTKRTEVENVSPIYDILSSWPQWIFVACLVVIHTCITFLVDVPDCGKGYLGPGGLDDEGKYFNCTGGVAGYIDRHVFGHHMYNSSKHAERNIYESKVLFDPEGILGILTSVVQVYLGVQAGKILNTFQNVTSKVIRWLVWGLVLCVIGGGLCGFKRDDGLIPINKRLWSLSFVLVTSGMAFVIQAALFVLVDITRKWGGRPFFYPGMNPIVLYVGHELFKNTFPFGWKPTQKTHGTFLFMNLWGTAMWVSIAIFMYKRNVFLSL